MPTLGAVDDIVTASRRAMRATVFAHYATTKKAIYYLIAISARHAHFQPRRQHRFLAFQLRRRAVTQASQSIISARLHDARAAYRFTFH